MFILTNDGSTKQWVEPESTNTGKGGIVWSTIVTEGRREFGLERAAVLSWASIGAQSGTMQLPLCAESQKLLSIFFASVEAVGLASDMFMVAAVAALALAAQEPDLRQSLSLWPVAPQNIHRFMLNLHLRSSEVSLPSLPSMSESSAVLPNLLAF